MLNISIKPTRTNVLFPLAAAGGAIAGCGLYFIYPSASVSVAWIVSILMLIFIAILRCFPAIWRIEFAVGLTTILFISFFYGWALYTVNTRINTKFLPSAIEDQQLWISGHIQDIDKKENKYKLTLNHVVFFGLDTPLEQLPQKIRISVSARRKNLDKFHINDWVSAQVKLYQPSPKTYPEAFDYRRWAYLEGIGATGYVFGEISTSQPWHSAKDLTWIDHINTWRKKLFHKETLKTKTLPHQSVRESLITGIKDNISPETRQYFIDSGLAHVLAISGLHIGMLTALIFIIFWRIWAFFPHLALQYNGRKVAAAAMIFSFGYVILAGCSIPTVRAFILVFSVLAGIIINRRRIGLRILALAAIFVLFIWPESIISASFQMSFIAALFLILWVESMRSPYKESQLQTIRSIGYIHAIGLTSLVAGLATMPFSAWHFGQISFAGFFANLLAVPVLGFLVLPLCLVGGVLWTVFPESIAFYPADMAAQLLYHIAKFSAGFKDLVFQVSRWQALAIGCITLICLCSFIYKNYAQRRLIVAVAAIALLVGGTPWDWVRPNSQLYVFNNISRNNQVVAIPNEYYTTVAPASIMEEGFAQSVLEEWRTQNHLPPLKKITETAQCDTNGCVQTLGNTQILILQDDASVSADDCRLADVIIQKGTHFRCPEKFLPKTDAVYAQVWLSNPLKIEPFVLESGYPWDHHVH